MPHGCGTVAVFLVGLLHWQLVRDSAPHCDCKGPEGWRERRHVVVASGGTPSHHAQRKSCRRAQLPNRIGRDSIPTSYSNTKCCIRARVWGMCKRRLLRGRSRTKKRRGNAAHSAELKR